MLEPTIDYEEGDIYYGTTTQPLHKRFNSHKSQYNQKSNYRTNSFFLFQKYGLDNIKIILVKEIICKNKDELNKEEGSFIRNNKCVNKNISGRTKMEWLEDNQEKIIEWKKKYKEKKEEFLTNRRKENREKSKEKKKELNKIYYEKNEEKIKSQQNENKEHNNNMKKLYYDKNKAEIKEKRKEIFECVCGCSCVISGKARHLKTKNHLSLIDSS